MIEIKKRKRGGKRECCPVMALVLERATGRFGVRAETIFSSFGGRPVESVVVATFAKAKDRNEKHANSTYAVFEHCPFCGKKLRERRK